MQDRRIDLEELVLLLEKGDSLPSLPTVFTRVLQLARDRGSSMRDFADVIRADPPLAMKVLQVVNSALYAPPQPITSLTHALTMLGVNEVRRLALSLSLINKFSPPPCGGVIPRNDFWEHAVTTAYVARRIAQTAFPKSEEELYTCGLLHDLGYLLIERTSPMRLSMAVQLAASSGKDIAEAERALVGADHTTAAEWLLRKSGLPEELVQAVAGHHTPSLDKLSWRTVIWAAARYSSSNGLGVFRTSAPGRLQDDNWRRFWELIAPMAGVDEDIYMAELSSALEKGRHFFSTVLSGEHVH